MTAIASVTREPANLICARAGVSRPDRWAVPSAALGQTHHVLVHPPGDAGADARGFLLVVLLDGGDQRQWSGVPGVP
jgi:hypothetical protein